jgi:hypothetical protein
MEIPTSAGPAGATGATGIPVFHPRVDTLVRWQRDWERWADGEQARAGLARWASDSRLAAHLASVGVLCAACGRDRRVPVPVADERLAALIDKARSGDQAAGRVVLERVMPALTERAGQRAAKSGRLFDEAFTDVVSCAWIAISTYPLDRQPVRIAANIVWDVEYLLGGYVRAVDQHTDLVAWPPEFLARPDGTPLDVPPNPSAELLGVLREGYRDGASRHDVALLAALGLTGARQRDLARDAGVTVRHLRRQRAAAVGALSAAIGNPDTTRPDTTRSDTTDPAAAPETTPARGVRAAA